MLLSVPVNSQNINLLFYIKRNFVVLYILWTVTHYIVYYHCLFFFHAKKLKN